MPEVETWEGEHLDYSWEAGNEPCAGVRERLDAFVPFVADELGLDPAEFSRISYTFLTYEAYVELHGPGAIGFARGRHAYSRDMELSHEVVHTVVHQRRRGGLPFLVEGLAVALSAGELSFYRETAERLGRFDRDDPRPYLDDHPKTDGSAFYGPGGGFVAYLLSRYGSERLWELHERVTGRASAERFAELFASVYGLDLDDEVAVFTDDETCPDDASAAPQPFACAAPTAEWASPERWVDLRALACGPLEDGDAELPQDWVTLEIPEDGLYRVELFGDERASLLLMPCGRCPWLAEDTYLRPGGVVVPLEAGLHAIAYSGERFDPLPFGASITRFDGDAP